MPRRPAAITQARDAEAVKALSRIGGVSDVVTKPHCIPGAMFGRGIPIEQLPLFANDREIGAALLGFERACEWKALAPLYERKGFPKIDPIMGGRYVPAIKAFFDYQYGLGSIIPTASDGTDRPDTWKTPVGQRHRD